MGHPENPLELREHNPKITTTFYPWSSSWHQANHILLAEDPMTYRTIQSSWQGHAFQALVKPTTKCQGLKRVWQVHSFQTPIETFSKCQGLKRVWQVHSFQTPSRLRLKHSPNVKVWRLLGRVTPSRLWLKRARKSRSEDCLAAWLLPSSSWRCSQMSRSEVWREFGRFTPSRLWLNFRQMSRSEEFGRFTPWRLCLDRLPKVKVWRLLGMVTPPKLWLAFWPDINVWRLLGRFTPSRLWLSRSPNVKVTPFRLWLKYSLNVRVWRLFGRVTPVKLLLNWLPNVKVWRLHGSVTRFRLMSNISSVEGFVVFFSNTSWLLHLLSRPLPPMQARLVDLVQQVMQHRNPLEDKCKRVLQHSPCLAPAMLCAVSDPSPWVQFVATLPKVNPYQMGSSCTDLGNWHIWIISHHLVTSFSLLKSWIFPVMLAGENPMLWVQWEKNLANPLIHLPRLSIYASYQNNMRTSHQGILLFNYIQDDLNMSEHPQNMCIIYIYIYYIYNYIYTYVYYTYTYDISHIINIYIYLIIQCMHSLYVCTHICHNHLGVNLSKSQQNRNSDPNE